MKTNHAQSLLELAIFGSLLIMLLGVLINYGLGYNFQQRVNQHVFRSALMWAAYSSVSPGDWPIGVSVVALQEKHIPDPSNVAGLGTIKPFMASASVTRDPYLGQTADNARELPVQAINWRPSSPWVLADFAWKTSGFRFEKLNLDPNFAPYGNPLGWEKYQLIYGEDNIQDTGECTRCVYINGGLVCMQRKYKIIDSCAGEIIDYASAVRQCRMIVSEEVCQKECEMGRQVEGDYGRTCTEVCSQEMNKPNQKDNSYRDHLGGAWYCRSWKLKEGVLEFPKLDELFDYAGSLAKAKQMGLQQDFNMTTQINNTLNLTTTAANLGSSDAISFVVDTNRTIIYYDGLDSNGVSYQKGRTIPQRNIKAAVRNWGVDTKYNQTGGSEWNTGQ